MKISIAMATYNGDKYLQEQLNSFLQQTILPDELVVCDDVSTDKTIEILQNFILVAPFKVRVVRNEKNLGYTQNFGKALSLCQGDIIFLSDQDDVWYPNKIDIVEKEFERNRNCLLVVNDADLCDEKLFKSGLTILGQLRNAGISDRQFVNGCCSAVRKAFLNIVLPIPDIVTNNHDGWIHDFGDLVGARKVIPNVLQLYRRHGNNSSLSIAASLHKISRLDVYKKYKNVDPREGYIKNIAALNLISSRIKERFHAIEDISLNNFKADEKLNRIINEKAAISRRIYLLGKSRFFRIGFAIKNYINGDYIFFKGWKSLVKDILR